ncbi:Cell wall-binding protein YocH [Sporomusa carbonis]|uniref:3D domain-containing protein n=1 Tax=Sporomusa carbonis TaxID=3076075 RepID=UPI003A7190D5
MKNKCHRSIKRRYKKIAAALASAAVMAAALIPGIPAAMHPAAKPAPDDAPVAAQEAPPPPEPEQQPTPAAPPEADAKQVLDIKATAYAPGPHDNDQWGDKTYLGTQIRPGVIAVDPRIIPLGSHVLIKYPDGSKEYAVAEDTGGAIKGHRIDVAKWTVREAQKFGIKPVKVYVLKHAPASQVRYDK